MQKERIRMVIVVPYLCMVDDESGIDEFDGENNREKRSRIFYIN